MSSQQVDPLKIVLPSDMQANKIADQLKLIKDHVTGKGFILPLKFAFKEKYRIAVLLSCKSDIYLPSSKDSASFRQAGYMIVKDTYAYTHNPKWKYISYLRKDALISYVAALVSKDNMFLWCEKGPQVEHDYAMLLVFLKDPALYFKLRLKPIVYVAMSTVASDENIAMKRWNKLEDRINRRLFRVMESNAIVLKHEKKIAKLSSIITKACAHFKNVGGDRQIDEIIEGWKNIAACWDTTASLTAREKFIELFYSNKAGFRNDAPVLLPFPMDEQSITVDGMENANIAIAEIMERNQRKQARMHHVPHNKGPVRFEYVVEEDEPEDLVKYKVMIASAYKSGNELTWPQVVILLDSYWVYVSDKQELHPQSKSKFAVPIVVTRLIRSHIIRLAAKNVTKVDKLKPIPTTSNQRAVVEDENRKNTIADLVAEVTKRLKRTLSENPRSYFKHIIKEQITKDAMFVSYSDFTSCIQKDVSTHMSNLMASPEYIKIINITVKPKILSGCFGIVAELLTPDNYLKDFCLSYLSYIYCLCYSFGDFLRSHNYVVKAKKYDTDIRIKLHQLIITASDSNTKEELEKLQHAIFNDNELKLDFLQNFANPNENTDINNKNSAQPEIVAAPKGVGESKIPKSKRVNVGKAARKKPDDDNIKPKYASHTTKVLVDELLPQIEVAREVGLVHERCPRDTNLPYKKLEIPDDLTDVIYANLNFWMLELPEYLKAALTDLKGMYFIYQDLIYLMSVDNLILSQFRKYFKSTNYTLHSLAYIYKMAAILSIKSELVVDLIKDSLSKKTKTQQTWIGDNVYEEFFKILELHLHLIDCLECQASKQIYIEVEQDSIDLELGSKELIHKNFVICQKELDNLYKKTNGRTMTYLQKNSNWMSTYKAVSNNILFEGAHPFEELNSNSYMVIDRQMGFSKISEYNAKNIASGSKNFVIKNCFTNNDLYETNITQRAFDIVGDV